jgi:phosphate starvation-inducible PhoH-like protein
VRRIVMAYESAARREREEREERLRAAIPEPQTPIESETEGLKRTLSRERPR